MKKGDRIIYWIATIWLALGMTSTGLVQLLQIPEETQAFRELGYAPYILALLGIAKILGVIAVLVPRWPLLKEWAYAGFVILMAGALYSHLASRDEASEFFGPTLLLLLTITSSYFRPESRKPGFVTAA